MKNSASLRFCVLASVFITGVGHAQESTQRLVFQDQTGLYAVEGKSCSSFDGERKPPIPGMTMHFGDRGYDDRAGPVTNDFEMIHQELTRWNVSTAVSDFLVYVNGFDLQYDNKDHHVQHVAAAVVSPSLASSFQTANWISRAELSDQGRDDEVTLCLHYTALAWDAASYDIAVTPLQGRLAAENNYWNVEALEPSAFVPTAFSLSSVRRGTDSHVFQLGFALNRPETSRVPNHLEAVGLWSDNAGENTRFLFSDITALSGKSVMPIFEGTEPITFEARKPSCAGRGLATCSVRQPRASSAARQQSFDTDGQYDLVLPVLTAFEMNYRGDDAHIARVGAWVDNIAFDGRRLNYTVSTIMTDKGSRNSERKTRVSYIAIRKLPESLLEGTGGNAPTVPVPEQGNNQVRVPARNQ